MSLTTVKTNAGYTEIDVTIRVEDLEESTYQPLEKVWDDLKIKLTGYDTNREGALPDAPGTNRFIWQNTAEANFERVQGGKGTLTLSIKLKNNPQSQDPKTIKNVLDEKGKLVVRVDLGSSYAEGEAKQVFGRPAVAPAGLSSNTQHYGLGATWESNKSVKYSKGIDQIPSSILLMLFEAADSNIELKATRIDANQDSSAEATSDITCRFDSGSAQCIHCDEANGRPVFLNSTQENKEAVKAELLSNTGSNGSYTFKSLDPEKEYILVAQYENGLQRSDCISARAGRTLSLTEANGEDSQKDFKDVRCFIATAAYGSPYHSYVEDFRWFRSTYLLKTSLGKRLVSFYYKNSPRFADIIADSPALKSVARGILFLPAMGVAGLRYAHSHSQAAWLAMGLLLTGLCFMLRKKFAGKVGSGA